VRKTGLAVSDYAGNYKLYALQGSGNVIQGWIKDLDFAVYSGPAIGEFEIAGENKKILFIGSQNGLVYAFDLQTWEPVAGWPKDFGVGKVTSPNVVDIDGDNENEIIITSGNGRIVVCKFDGSEWNTVSDLSIGSGFACTAVSSDLDGDGITEVIVGASNGTIYVWNFSGGNLNPAWSLPIGEAILSSPIIGNFDMDNELEIACYTTDGRLNIINNDGSLIENELIGNSEALSPARKGVLLPGVLGSEIFFSQSGSYVSNAYRGNPSFSITEWGMFHHMRQPHVVDLSASPDPFSPNDDGRKDTTSITSQIDTQTPCEGKLSIYGGNAQLIKTLKEGQIQSGQFVWDGKNVGGTYVSSETYNVLLQIESEMSDKISQLNTLVVDTIKPSFLIFSASPEVITPAVGSLFEYYPSEPSQLTISLLNSDGSVYKTHSEFLEPSELTTESYEYEWDGTGDHNQVFSGTYTYVATLEDLAGNISDPEEGAITVDIDSPFVNGVYAEPEVFSTVSDINKTSIHYAIPEQANVWVRIRNSEGNLIKNLLDSESKPSGAHSIDWDGSDNSGSLQPDGHYTYMVEAVDLNGNESATIENTVEIDNTPPSILQVSVIPSEFSPQSDSALAALSFFISEKADINVEIIYSSDAIVKTVASEEEQASGSYSYDWDGTDTEGASVADGNYAFRITAVDVAGNTAIIEEAVVANSLPPCISDASVNPNLFTPNSGLSNSWTKISYTLSGGIGNVLIDVNILNASHGTVKRLLEDEITISGNYSEFWYGDVDSAGGFGDLDGDGYADGGEYIVEIIATDSLGNQAEVEIQVEVADNPDVSAYVDPTVFSPAAGQSTTVYYNIDYSELLTGNAQVWIKIYDSGGTKVYEFSDSVSRGNYTHVWDGSNNHAGGTVADGTYQVKVQAEDPEGNNVIAYSNNVIVTSGPEITINGVNPNPFTPNIFESTSFDFSVSSDTSTYYVDPIRIYDSGDNLVKTLAKSQIVWNGSVDGPTGDLNGDGLADEAIYTFKIRVTDEAANEAVGEGQVLVNRLALHLSEPTGTSSLNPDHFSPAVVESTTITYTLGKTSEGPVLGAQAQMKTVALAQAVEPIGYVTVEVRAQDDSLIKTLVPDGTDNGERDAGTYQISWDGKDESGTLVSDGEYKIKITAYDLVGNPAESESMLTYNLVLDATPPTGSVLVDGGNQYANDRNVNLDLQANDALSSVVSMKLSSDGVFDDETEEDYAVSKAWVLDEGDDGDRTVFTQLKDEAGNWSTDEISDLIILDTLPPEITNISADPQYFSPITSVGTKDAAVIYYSLNEGADIAISVAGVGDVSGFISKPSGVNSFTWDPGGIVSEGEYYYTIYATDEAGNGTQTTGTDFVVVDNTLPTAQITHPSAEAWRRASFDIIGDVEDDNPGVTFVLQYSPSSEVNWQQIGNMGEGNVSGEVLENWDTIWVGDDSYYVRLFATDAAGNGAVSQALYHIDNTPPEQPTYLTATTEDSAAILSWNPITTPEVSDVYNVYRSSTYNGSYAKINSFPALSPTFKEIGLVNGVRYWYKVTAGDRAGNETDYTNYIAATPGILNSTRIAFESYRTGNFEIFKINIDGGGLTNLTGSGAREQDPSYSPDGSRMAYAGNDNIYIMNADGSGKTFLVGGNNASPNFSPDGTKIVFSSYRDGTGWHIYIMNVDGSSQQKLTSSSGFTFNMKANFSPDGAKIIYHCSDPWAGTTIKRMNADGTNNETIVGGYAPAYSPDGAKIFFQRGAIHSGKSHDQIWVMNSDGTDTEMLREDPRNAGAWSLESCKVWPSPSNTMSTFNNQSTGNPEVYKINIDGGAPVNLTSNGAEDKVSVWSPFPAPGVGPLSLTKSPIKVLNASSLTLECISPIGGAVVQTLRPTFKWYGLKDVMDYRIECALTSDEADLANTFDYFTPTISYDQAQEDMPIGSFTIPRHQTGLDENDSTFNSEPYWYWRVKAISEEAIIGTSEVASFSIQLPVSVSGVINYPNPFNSNKERTKIRYKLGKEANSVTIRIYDITGALVKELDGETRGEGSSIWDKYNEVEWDGRNGRGDLVINGVYPFEVVVSSGGKTASGRGKIVVLK
jgi:flagellar hook assembly protein FlgD